MVKIVFSEYREMETGKYLPFKEANEKLGALDQTFLKENQANDKWDDLYSLNTIFTIGSKSFFSGME